VAVPDAAGGLVELKWLKSNDNGPSSEINYEIQVATDGGFQGIEAQIFSPAGTDAAEVYLAVSRYDKFWRLRALDVGGNLSEWSPPLAFRVTWNDGINHGSGDAKQGCGLAAASAAPWLPGILAALALLAGGMRKVRGR
jgi:hypothetical protein